MAFAFSIFRFAIKHALFQAETLSLSFSLSLSLFRDGEAVPSLRKAYCMPAAWIQIQFLFRSTQHVLPANQYDESFPAVTDMEICRVEARDMQIAEM